MQEETQMPQKRGQKVPFSRAGPTVLPRVGGGGVCSHEPMLQLRLERR